MKKVALTLLIAVIAVAMMSTGVEQASARPAYNKIYLAKHTGEAYKAQKCYGCHAKAVSSDPKDKVTKKDRNEYGLALSKFITGADYKKLNVGDDKAAKVEKKFLEAYEKAGALKSKSGKTFAEKLEAGELPAADTNKVTE